MYIDTRTNQNITPNVWVLDIIQSLKLRLNGHNIYITFKYNKIPNEMYALKVIVNYLLLNVIPDADLHGITIQADCDMGDSETDLILVINYENFEEPDPYNRKPKDFLGKLLHFFTDFSLKNISFHDWNSIDPIEIQWVNNALCITIPFESSGDKEVLFKKSCLEGGVSINDFKIKINLVPYVFWFPGVTFPKNEEGTEFQTTLISPQNLKNASGQMGKKFILLHALYF